MRPYRRKPLLNPMQIGQNIRHVSITVAEFPPHGRFCYSHQTSIRAWIQRQDRFGRT
jgi:hypothetical protein